MAAHLTQRELDVLMDMPYYWVRPMDIGGRDGSDHSAVLRSLARKGAVERRRRNTLANDRGSRRGSYEYRRRGSQETHDLHGAAQS